jgi:uncharacterized protein
LKTIKSISWKIWMAGAAVLLLVPAFLYWQNNSVTINEMKIVSGEIPGEFQGFKIVQLSDLHSKSFGKEQEKLIDKVIRSSPDIIVFTGDLVDQKKYDEHISMKLMTELTETAPVYFVSGNHEWWSGRFPALEEKLGTAGVTVLRNEALHIKMGSEKIVLAGIDDPAGGQSTEESLNASLQNIPVNDTFTILLSHRPELFTLYAEHDADLIFSGHAHGGQVRIPLLGGLVAPDQGFLPEYDGGKYEIGGSQMIVNRGLGNSIIPQRLFNRPEIIVVTLSSD